MIVDRYWDLRFFKTSSEVKAPKKSLENTIGLAFVEVHEQLRQLAEAKDLEQVRRFVPAIQNQLFELYNECVHGLNVAKFAKHMSGDRTPLNSRCC